MRYEKIKNLESKEFRRLTGVKPETFKAKPHKGNRKREKEMMR